LDSLAVEPASFYRAESRNPRDFVIADATRPKAPASRPLPGQNQLYLYPDNGDGSQASNIVLTSNNTISNSQCTISAQGASFQASGGKQRHRRKVNGPNGKSSVARRTSY
jgi:hypothetical protein